MTEAKQYLLSLFLQKKIIIAGSRNNLFDEFINEEATIAAVKQIQENQKMMIDKWTLRNKIKDIIDKQLIIPNGTVRKPYEAALNFIKLGMNDIVYTEFEGLDEFGLAYNREAETIKGNPSQSGDFKVKMKFRVAGEEDDSALHEKQVSLVINADPKSLWKDIPSTQTENNYWKPDTANDFQPLGDKHIVVVSKRGRSHANVGSFRDDDFAFKHFENTGWSIVCVADGAGSAKLSRQGSKIACDGVIEYFSENFNDEILLQFDNLVKEHSQNAGEESQKKLNLFLYNNLGKAAFTVHKKLEDAANKLECAVKDFHSTLIFALFKKYEFGYAILTFGVGDCPIGLLNKDMSEIKLMNWLDVGEFGGGTRFITMPEIFSSDKFPTRFGFKLIEDFSYLMLMTDGIYDPKFVVEVNLEKTEKWIDFIDDLRGNNDEKICVEFNPDNKEIANQLSGWMDFWSPGNHDDRTLAIVF
jgi:Protein phosphatase 2C